MADANQILGLHNTKVKVKPLVADDLVDPHCLASKKSVMMLFTAFLPEKTLMETVTELWTEADETQHQQVDTLNLSHIVKRDAKGRRGALVPNPKALKRRPALKRVSLLPEPVEEVVLPSEYINARVDRRTYRWVAAERVAVEARTDGRSVNTGGEALPVGIPIACGIDVSEAGPARSNENYFGGL